MRYVVEVSEVRFESSMNNMDNFVGHTYVSPVFIVCASGIITVHDWLGCMRGFLLLLLPMLTDLT